MALGNEAKIPAAETAATDGARVGPASVSVAFLTYCAWWMLVTAGAAVAVIVLIMSDQRWRAGGPAIMLLVSLTTLRMIAIGREQAACHVLIWGCWLAVTGISLFVGGLRSMLMTSYPLLVMIGGWLLGMRTATTLAVANLLVIAGFAVGEIWTLLPPQPPTPVLLYGVVYAACSVFALMLIVLLIRSYQERITDVQRLSRALSQRTADLQAREDDLKQAQALAHVGSWACDMVHGQVVMSDEACRILGYSEGSVESVEVLGVLVHPEDQPQFAEMTAAAGRGECRQCTLRVIVARRQRWITLSTTIEFDESGRPWRVVGTIQDVSATKELEASLRSEKEFFRLISESIGEHIAVLDLDGSRVYTSPSYRQLLGDRRELSGTNSFADIHPEDRERVKEVFRQTTATGVGQQLEYRLLRRDGSVRYMASSGRLIRGESGADARVVVVSRDVTDHKRAEQWARIAATAFESQQGMFITDANSVILRVNQAFTDITGYSGEECMGQTPRLLSSGRHDATFYAEMKDHLERDGVWQGEIWNRRKNGEVFPEWLTISAVRDSSGVVTHYVAALTDMSAHKATQEEIRHLAFYDALTGLPNRRLLHDRLRVALASSGRSERQGALLFIDLDNFKTLNDTLGHDQGDLLLQQVSKRLASCVREGDTVARLGGDEFVIMLENLGHQPEEAAGQSKVVAEKILAVLNRPYDLQGQVYHNTPSIGVTLFGEHLVGIDELMKRADLAMYEAKAAGRNALRFFDPRMQAVVSARAAIEKDLRQAIEKGLLTLVYQPQVDRRGRTVGAEALLRWPHPERGMISPSEFIPIAEETGLILPLGQWVLESACAQAARWAAQPGREDFTVAVNVSAQQFRQANFVDQVMGVLAASGASPRNLKLELTESMLLDNVQDVIAKMSALKQFGVGFSLDDFGIGYSSLSYLKRLPIDQLKIDQSFVRDLLNDPNDEVIARTIIALASTLGLSVIAEGVESSEQHDVLATHGCYVYQGYLFSHPLNLVDFNNYLQRH